MFKTFYSSKGSTGYAYTQQNYLVTSTSTATSESTLNQEDADIIAQIIADNVAMSVAMNDANIIDQCVTIVQGNMGKIIGPTGATGARGATGTTGATGPPLTISGTSGGQFLVLSGDKNVYTTDLLSATKNTVITNATILPGINNVYSLGSTSFKWAEIFMGPGTLNIAGPSGSTTYATLGSDINGIVYTEFGFASPFLNVGPAILTPNASGGWK